MNNLYKKILLLVVVFIVAIFFWFAIKSWVGGVVKFTDPGVWLTPLIALLILASVTAISLVLIDDRLYSILVPFLIGLGFLIVFNFNTLYPGTFSALILFQLYGGKLLREEVTERNRINLRVILRRGMPWVILPLLIMVSFAFYLDPRIQAAGGTNELPSTIKQVISQTVTNFLGRELQSLPSAERQSAENQITNQVINTFTDFLKPYFKYTPPVLAFGLFLILQGLSLVFVWLSVWLGMAIFLMLKKINFVRIIEKTTMAEELKL